MHHIYIYIIHIYTSPCKGNARKSLKQSTFYEVGISTSLVGLEPTISRLHTEFHYSWCLRPSKQGISNIFLYIRVSKQRNCIQKWQQDMNWICPMTAILNFMICGKMVSFIAWHTAEMDSAQNFHIETTNEVLLLKNAYRSLSRAIFHFFYYIPSSITRDVSDHQSKASQIYFYISGSPNKEIVYENDNKIWIEYVRWRPFWISWFVGKWCHL